MFSKQKYNGFIIFKYKYLLRIIQSKLFLTVYQIMIGLMKKLFSSDSVKPKKLYESILLVRLLCLHT